MRIIGLDPGLRNMGWGVVDQKNGRLSHVDHGVILSGTGDLSVRLAVLFRELSLVFTRLQPDTAAVEETFLNTNPGSTLKLGQARAVCMLVPALSALPVAEYAPNTVKKSLVGQGHAAKHQVEHMVRLLLKGVTTNSADATDALALAICHAHHLDSPAVRLKVGS